MVTSLLSEKLPRHSLVSPCNHLVVYISFIYKIKAGPGSSLA